MNEAVKPRFAVDLDEIERQLAHANSAPAHAAPSRNDPLAELARIVGQDDPFQSLLGEKSRQRAAEPAGLDDLFVVRDEAGKSDVRQQQGYGLRGTVEAESPQAHAYAEPSVQPYRTADAQHYDTYQEPAYDPDYYQQESADQESLVYAPQDERGHRAAKAGARKGKVALGAVAAAVLLGLGGAFFYGSGQSVLSSGEPPLITADNQPTKIQPQSPGGVEIPNQNKQIYERAAHETQTKVVNREEQPVDVRQATRVQNASAEATGTTNASSGKAAPAAGGLNLGEPRRVRTLSIRPDGSVIGAEPAARSAVQAPAATAMSQPGQAAPVAPAMTQSTPAPRPAPATPAAATTPKGSPSPAAVAGGASPQPSSTPAGPASQPAPQRVASAQPIAVAPTTPAPVETASTGGFAVQLAVSGSEGEAKATFQKLQQKFADLGGQPSMIRKAEVNGNTVFRVRVGPMSRDDASSLCSKLQGQGGQCFVAKN